MNRSSISLAAAAVALTGLFAAPASAQVLDAVKQRGTLNCGTDNTAPGFGYLDTKTGKMQGMDVDMCRAMAAAVLGDASKVNFVVVTDKSRFTAVQTNQVDVVFAHTTVNPARESAVGIDFLPVTFWDGTGAMVKTDSKVASVADLDGASLCTTQGSGTETAIAGYIKSKGWKNQVLTYENLEKLFGALNSGRCDAMFTDKSALAAWRGNAGNPNDYVILPEVLEKSPFAGFVAANDSKWRNTLRWITFALFQAEESGISSKTLVDNKKSDSPLVRKFLGVEGGYGTDFGIPNDFVSKMIEQVGNYAEIYDRNIGPDTPYFIDRKGTPNAAWKDGGQLLSLLWN
jgi:general L-amino acid transport system substrate-binding protein